MSTVVDVKDSIELRAAGLRALNNALGDVGANLFIDQFFGGEGDYTAEKKNRPATTPAELEKLIALAKADD